MNASHAISQPSENKRAFATFVEDQNHSCSVTLKPPLDSFLLWPGGISKQLPTHRTEEPEPGQRSIESQR